MAGAFVYPAVTPATIDRLTESRGDLGDRAAAGLTGALNRPAGSRMRTITYDTVNYDDDRGSARMSGM